MRNQSMHSFVSKFSAALLALALIAAMASAQATPVSFVVPIDGSQENPPTATAAVGTSYGWLDSANMLTVTFCHNVAGANAAHIHQAAVGSNGGVIFAFSSAANGHSQTFGPLTAMEVADLMAGLFYVNIHSGTFPGGEIRGQISTTFAPQVYINEYCNDPLGAVGLDTNCDGTLATGASQSDDEFVEIINGTCDPVDIGGWTLSDAAQVRHVFDVGTILPPFGCIVVFGGGDVTTFNNVKGCAGVLASSSSLGLNNNGDTITLLDGSAATVDSTTYASGSAGDGNGESVVRASEQAGMAFGLHTLSSSLGLFHSAGLSQDGLCKFPPATLPAPPVPTYPGNGGDVAIEVTVNGATSSPVMGVHDVFTADSFTMTFTSPGGTLTGTPFLVIAQLFPTVAPPLPEAVLGVFFDASVPVFVLVDGLSNPLDLFNPVLGSFTLSATLPPALDGLDLSVFVNCLAADAPMPFGLSFADAQEFRVQTPLP